MKLTTGSIAMALLVFLAVVPGFGQQWSTPVTVSSGDTPDMDIDRNTGYVYILSMVNGVTVTKVSPEGAIIAQEIVPGAESDAGGGNFGASIAVDSKGYPHVCYRRSAGTDPDGTPKYNAYYVKKTAAGWQSRLTLSNGVRRGYVVRIDIDDSDVAHIVQGFAFDEEGSEFGRLIYYRVVNNAVNKQVELGAAYPYIYRGNDRAEITTSGKSNVYILSGVPNEDGPVYFIFSPDGGNSFTNFGDIHHNDAFGRNGSPDVAVDSLGNVHICYGTSQDATRLDSASVRYTKFTGENQTLDNACTPNDYLTDWKIGMGLGSIACSDNGQVLITAFVEYPGGPLYTTLSTDAGQSWATPVQLVTNCGSDVGRNKHIIRSRGNKFYLVYPYNYTVQLRAFTFETNDPPVADAGGPYTQAEGSTILFDAAGSSDPDGIVVQYEWDWQNDAIFDTTTTSAVCNHRYTDDFYGQINLRVTDNEGGTHSDLASVTVYNVNPVAEAGGPYQGQPNVEIDCHASATDAGADDVPSLIYQWDVNGDGIYATYGQNIKVKFANGGIYTIRLRVVDNDGGIGLDSATVNITNQPPVVAAIPPQSVNEGTPFNTISLDSYVTDPDNRDDQMVWSARGQVNLTVVINASRVATISPVKANWFGAEMITFTATDPGFLKDSTSTTFTIANVNDRPAIAVIPDQTIPEGGSFAAINLDEYVSDPDHADNQISWQVFGNSQLLYQIQNRVLTVIPPNTEWSGSEQLSIVASDPLNARDTTQTRFTVSGENDPPNVTKIPDQNKAVGTDFSSIALDDYVSDPDNPDSDILWTYSGNTKVTVEITNRVASIERVNPTWVGSDTVIFNAADPGGLSGSSSVIFTSSIGNQPPDVTHIPDQSILEGQSFQTVNLDGYVTDPDNPDNEITWTASGQNDLIITIHNRVVTISQPLDNPDWSGMEVVNFKATDPGGLADSSLTLFIVMSVNDPPVLSTIPNTQFLEDDTLEWPFSNLWSLVRDPDNDSSDFQFQISGNSKLTWFSDGGNKILKLFGAPNWHGSETVTLTVYDGNGGSDSEPWNLTVVSVPDNPSPFMVKYPRGETFSASGDTIHFSWRRAADPEGGTSMYQLSIADEIGFNHVIDQFNTILDSSLSYVTQSTLAEATYYWRVVAFNSVGSTASDIGTFVISSTAVNGGDESAMPTRFALLQNYPNPFNPETCISYTLPKLAAVKLEIFNALGQRVLLASPGEQGPGVYRYMWDARSQNGELLPSGIYICRLQAEGQSYFIKMVLLQ
ncbi:MAG: PKD domain-containing protein [Candidatus Zhuqueibacterota bacterium]